MNSEEKKPPMSNRSFRNGGELQPFQQGRGVLPQLAGPPPAAHSVTPVITVSTLLHAFRRWWKWAIPLGLVCGAAAGAAVFFLFEPQFAATRDLHIQSQRPHIVFPQQGESTLFARTQMALLKNRFVLDNVVSRSDIAQLKELRGLPDVGAKVQWLKDRIRVYSVEKSELYQVKFEGPDPNHTVRIVNAVVDEYLERYQSRGQLLSTELKKKLEEVYNRQATEVQAKRNAVMQAAKELADASGVSPLDPIGDTFVLHSKLAKIQSDIASNDVDKTVLEIEKRKLEDEIDKLQPGLEELQEAIDTGLAQNQQLQNLYLQLGQAQVRLADRKAIAAEGSKNPLFAEHFQNLIARYEEQIQDLTDELKPKLEEAARERFRKRNEARLQKYAQDIQRKGHIDQLLQEQFENQREQLASTSDESQKLQFLRYDLQQATEIRRKIGERIESMDTEAEAPGRVFAYSPATSAVPTKQHKIPRILMAVVGGCGFPFFLAILWEMKVRRIGTSDQIPGESPVRVVGEISALPTRPSVLSRGRTGSYYNYYRNTFEESVDYLRTSLLLSDQFSDMQILSVASAVSREGKTSLASHLAVSVARSTKEPTLLIDSDMRNPGIHDLFDVHLSPGLSELLEGQCQFDEAICVDAVPNLHILPAGELSTSPHVLLGNGALSAVLEQARHRYRYVIVDTPPVLPVSDALVITKACDGTLISTMRDVSRGPQVKRACERLEAAGANLLGAVLSGVPPQSYTSRYGPYSYQYQRYTARGSSAATRDVGETA